MGVNAREKVETSGQTRKGLEPNSTVDIIISLPDTRELTSR